jgi:hypothetical protein
MARAKFPGVQIEQVGAGRRMTKSFFRQVVFDPHWETGTPLGWVNYFWSGDGEKEYGTPRERRGQKFHLLWRKGNEFRRCFVYANPPEYGPRSLKNEERLIRRQFERVEKLPQLFLGEFLT